MDFAVIILSIAVVIAAGILAFAPTRPKAVTEPAKPDPRLDAVISGQGAITEQFRQTVAAQAALGQQVDALKQKLGESLTENAAKTGETLGGIQARLSAIDEAQKNISALSGHVVSLQQIFSDKQQRGAFAQERMEAIVADQFPPGHYDFQFTLTNGKRPDCVIRIPNVAGVLVIDAKFPWEAFEALRTATEEPERKTISQRLRADMQKHVKDISEKYLIPGEVQTPAIMFVPSESLYAELHLSFPDIIQGARRQQVMIMSPHVFLLALGTIQALMRDAKMREQAHRIQKEVGALVTDVKRLGDRVGNLQRHFGQVETDLKDIGVSTDKIIAKGERIEKVELGAEPKSLT